MISFIVNTTSNCNANCIYCYPRKQGTYTSISIDTIENLLKMINDYLLSNTDESVEILWHGGEPMLLGAAFYASAKNLTVDICKTTRERLHYSMQSNLTCLNQKLAVQLKSLGIISIGTSYDPSDGIRQIGHKKDGSLLYTRKFMSAIALLDHNDIRWGINYVVTRHSLNDHKKLLNFLSNLCGYHSINFSPALPTAHVNQHNHLTPEEYSQFLGELFLYWWPYRHRFPNVEPFGSLCKYFLEGDASNECMALNVCDNNLNCIYLNEHGEMLNGMEQFSQQLKNYGKPGDSSLEDILHIKKEEHIQQQISNSNQNQCKICCLRTFCHPLPDDDIVNQSLIKPDEWCSSRRDFLNKYFYPATGYSP